MRDWDPTQLPNSESSGCATDDSISIVIPSWNGLALLRENLPSILASSHHYSSVSGAPCEILVIDDGSTDGTVESVPLEFPQVQVISRPRNDGFAAACNTGFEHCRFRLIALINNDVQIDLEYFCHQAPHFMDPDTFAVTARVFEWKEAHFATGGRYGKFRRGFWSVYFNYDAVLEGAEEWIERRELLSIYAIGGFATFDRSKLEELGGFLELLSPFHWEDVDLSYRAWKRGWAVHYEPRSIGRHRTSATINAFYKKRQVESVSFRNRLLFHWINLHSPTYLAAHILMLAVWLPTRILVLDVDFYRALFQALRCLGQVRKLRLRERKKARRSDREVSAILNTFYQLAPIRVYYNRREVVLKHPGLPGPLAAPQRSDAVKSSPLAKA